LGRKSGRPCRIVEERPPEASRDEKQMNESKHQGFVGAAFFKVGYERENRNGLRTLPGTLSGSVCKPCAMISDRGRSLFHRV
ncbi:MAG: hypothetical protein OXC72_15010, partial [Roseovarius sp.]|nr:hypothetical protein [Roseovarius sp.]